MGLEQREERQDRPRRHHERGRPQGEGHRCASPPPETPRYRTWIPPGSKARLHPGITQANGTRSLQTHIPLSKSAMVTVPRPVPVAAGVLAPGHLGELTGYVPFELVDGVLEETLTVQRRTRLLPSRVGVYFVLTMAMFPRLGYLRVWD